MRATFCNRISLSSAYRLFWILQAEAEQERGFVDLAQTLYFRGRAARILANY
tara:strand:+ start:963 stop:1118 length:156 start_codon:yes stop_codon:yes gene_type:complete